jgi:hypothetical protein
MRSWPVPEVNSACDSSAHGGPGFSVSSVPKWKMGPLQSLPPAHAVHGDDCPKSPLDRGNLAMLRRDKLAAVRRDARVNDDILCRELLECGAGLGVSDRDEGPRPVRSTVRVYRDERPPVRRETRVADSCVVVELVQRLARAGARDNDRALVLRMTEAMRVLHVREQRAVRGEVQRRDEVVVRPVSRECARRF